MLTSKENAMESETMSPKASNNNTATEHRQILSREQQFMKTMQSRNMLEKVPDVGNTLVRSKIDPFVRGKLIGWIVEVLDNLKKPFSYGEVFRTIVIMDLYVKHCPEILENDDMHLIGVTSVFVSSKYETNTPLRINDLSVKACHGKFSNNQIFEQEFIILKTLSFNLAYPTHFDVLRLFLFELFENDNAIFKIIEVTSTNFLLFCLMDVHFNNYMMDYLSIATIVTATRYYYSCKMARVQGALNFGKIENFSKQEKIILTQILEYSGRPKEVENLSRLIMKYLKGFKQRFFDCSYVIKLFDFDEKLIGK